MIRYGFLLLAGMSLVRPANAQLSVYGALTVEQMSGIQSSPVLNTFSPPPCTSALTTNCTAYNNSVHPLGFTGGATYDFKTVGPVRLGIDARAILQSDKRGAQTNAVGAGTRIYSGLGGVKATFNTPLSYLRPYVQGSFGYARSNYGVLTNAAVSTSTTRPGIPTQGNLEYHVFAGADLKFLSFADWRVLELGYGGLHSLGTYSHTYPLYSLSTGIVIHFPPRP